MKGFVKKEQFKFVIVGHVDHGKSTMIGRLLYETGSVMPDKIEEAKRISESQGQEMQFAYLLDHLEEERRQGITIDTTQVFFRTKKREYVIIDAPGHVEFVRNMITGASLADAAFLIIDAKEGVKEQTTRHAFLVSLIGIKNLIVLVNKMDIAGFSEKVHNEIKNEMEKFSKTINIKPLQYIPVSALKGDNIVKRSENTPWYKGATALEALDALTVDDKSATVLALPVQDVYRDNDTRVIAGRIESGAIQAGDKVEIQPNIRTARVMQVRKFLDDKKSATKGESVGVTFTEPVFIERGDVITRINGDLGAHKIFGANIFWLSKEGFSKNERVTLRCSTQETTAKVKKIDERIDSSTLNVIERKAQSLGYLEVGKVTIELKKPIVISMHEDMPELGRFVFVKNGSITAGGIITGIKKDEQ